MPAALPKGRSALNQVVLCIKHNAKNAGREFDLDPEEVVKLIQLPCHYCGCSPSNHWKTAWGSEADYNGLDRVDNSKGYVEGNVVPCCYTCNGAKSSMSVEDFLAWIDRLCEWRQK